MNTQPEFQCDASVLAAKWQSALTGLSANVVSVHGYDRPVLIEGGAYPGIWLECGPLEGSIYGMVDPDVAVDNHRIFFRQQHADGYLPCYIWKDRSGKSQIQMVVPIAATAWDVFQQQGDIAFLDEAYRACCAWDAWLLRWRNTRGTGLCEAFCEYDTGHDNSPRFAGLPHEAQGGDARHCPTDPRLPYLAPDLSATVYGGRRALAQMADRLGRADEARTWNAAAEQIRKNLLALCFDPQSECFYDLDPNLQFVRIRGDLLTRVLGEHIPDQTLFDKIWGCHLGNPEGFWTPFPFPSIAINDPSFVRPIPGNSWGGAAQALTALSAPRWMEHYGKHANLTWLMQRWIQALCADSDFRQQMDPVSGVFSPDSGRYSPAMLVLIDFVRRLHGTVHLPDRIEWGCLPLESGRYWHWRNGRATIIHNEGRTHLHLDSSSIAEVIGPCRLVTDQTNGIDLISNNFTGFLHTDAAAFAGSIVPVFASASIG